jgi:response regulator of citrate/malate metabolism
MSIETVRELVKNAKPVTYGDLANAFNMSRSTIRKWIKENCPEVKFSGKQKKYFTPKEVDSILKEWTE